MNGFSGPGTSSRTLRAEWSEDVRSGQKIQGKAISSLREYYSQPSSLGLSYVYFPVFHSALIPNPIPVLKLFRLWQFKNRRLRVEKSCISVRLNLFSITSNDRNCHLCGAIRYCVWSNSLSHDGSKGIQASNDLGNHGYIFAKAFRLYRLLEFRETHTSKTRIWMYTKFLTAKNDTTQFAEDAKITSYFISRWPARGSFVHCIYGTLYGGERRVVDGTIWIIRRWSSFITYSTTIYSSVIFCQTYGTYIFHHLRIRPYLQTSQANTLASIFGTGIYIIFICVPPRSSPLPTVFRNTPCHVSCRILWIIRSSIRPPPMVTYCSTRKLV